MRLLLCKGLLADLAEDRLKWALPFQLQWIEELGVLGRLRQLAPELQEHIDREGVAGSKLEGKGRRLPEVTVRIGKSSSGNDLTSARDVVLPLANRTSEEAERVCEADSSDIVDSRQMQTLAARISGPRLYQWMLGGVPLPDATSATLSLSEAYQLPCELQLKYVSKDGTPLACSDVGTSWPKATSAWEMACTMLTMTAAEPNSSAAPTDGAPQVFVKTLPGLTCVVWNASGTQHKRTRSIISLTRILALTLHPTECVEQAWHIPKRRLWSYTTRRNGAAKSYSFDFHR